MSFLSPGDVAIIVVYILGTTLLGAWFARRQRDVRTYFVGDRDVGWLLLLVSIVATETSTVTFLGVPGLAFDPKGGNFTFLQLAFGYVLGRIIIAWLLLPSYFRGEWFTAYQLLRERFSPSVQRTASALFLLTRTVADGLRLYLTALLLGQVTGWDMRLSLTFLSLVTLAYTYLGGMQAVIWTDVIQFVIYILGALLAGAVLLRLLPGGWDTFLETGRAADKFRLFNFDPSPAARYTLWTGLIGGAFLSMASHGADQMMVQRYLCARSLGQARAALVLSGGIVTAQFLLFLSLGVGLFALHDAGLLPLAPNTPNDEVFGAFIVRHLPTGLVGLVIAAVLASAMSSLSSSLNSSAGASVTDFYRPLRPDRSEAHYLRVSRLFTLGWGLLHMGVGLAAVWAGSPRSIVDQVLGVAGLTSGIVLGLFLLGQARRPVPSAAALAGMAIGFVVVFALWLPSTWGTVLVAWPWYAPAGVLTTVAVAWLVDKLGVGHGSSADRGAQPGLDKSG